VSPYLRTVKTASGATAVQIVYSSHRGSRDIEHVGSAHDGAELELLKAAARQRLAAGQGELDLGLGTAAPGGPLPITSSRMGHLLDALSRAYDVLGLGHAAGGDEVFRLLVLARVIEPTAISTPCGCWRRPGWRRRRMRHSSAACPSMPRRRGGRGCPPPARRMPGWAGRAWCSMTCRRCISRPMPGTGSVSRGSRRSAAWTRRSPSAR
jgi:hypothetical protein